MRYFLITTRILTHHNSGPFGVNTTVEDVSTYTIAIDSKAALIKNCFENNKTILFYDEITEEEFENSKARK